MHLRPVQFVDAPFAYPDGAVARLAGGMQWFAAYEVIESGGKRIVPIADIATLSDRAAELHARFTALRPALTLGARTLRFDQPTIAAILNMTPDSFSDGGAHHDDPAAAASAGMEMAGAGAALIDVGGESTRPGATQVWEEDEAKRVVPVIERLALVMERALAAGAAIVNDVSALLWDKRALDVVARAGCPVIVMHSPDPEKDGHGKVAYCDVACDVFDWLDKRIDALVSAGIERTKIIVDPGIGFGKSLHDNLALINALAMFHGTGCPVMLGASRKRLIGALSNEAPVDQRLGGSVALALKGADAGVQMLRVHDVAETVQALRIWRGLRDRAFVG
jgi:dihydropteroate synthase